MEPITLLAQEIDISMAELCALPGALLALICSIPGCICALPGLPGALCALICSIPGLIIAALPSIIAGEFAECLTQCCVLGG